ncbi:hypothetical protein DITRI_Ditri13aG0019500 [Diplodiscus trichospermus]
MCQHAGSEDSLSSSYFCVDRLRCPCPRIASELGSTKYIKHYKFLVSNDGIVKKLLIIAVIKDGCLKLW